MAGEPSRLTLSISASSVFASNIHIATSSKQCARALLQTSASSDLRYRLALWCDKPKLRPLRLTSQTPQNADMNDGVLSRQAPQCFARRRRQHARRRPHNRPHLPPSPALLQSRRVCIAVDPSQTSQEALRWAARWVVRPGDELRLFTVLHPTPESEMAAEGGGGAGSASATTPIYIAKVMRL